ncbi:MAG: STAS domain-containing protein [Streptosporangiaceae bacterium]
MTDVMEMREAGFPVEMTGGVPVVVAPEEIDITNAAELRSALLHAAARGCPTIVLDMAQTTFCDSAGLHALLGAHQRAQSEGAEVRFVVTGAAVRRILALTAMDRLLSVYTSLDDALTEP